MSTSRRLLALLRNPLVIIPPLVIALVFGWQQYTYAGRDLNLPQGINLMPGGVFNDFDANGVPSGWTITSSGQPNCTAGPAKGYAGGKAFRLNVSRYQAGDVDITSPKAQVVPGKTYLYKGYYTATAPFSLLARLYHADGSSTLQLVQTYPAASNRWLTASDAFRPADGVVAAQFVYRVYGNGTLELNSFYLETQQHAYIPSAPVGNNLIPNPSLSLDDTDMPSDWNTYGSDNNNAAFSYLQDTAGPYLTVQVSRYTDGEAKWQYPPQAVQPHQAYQFGVAYQSDTSVPIVAEYVLSTGERQYQTVATLRPADQWTSVSYPLEVPDGAANMFVSLPLQHSGTLNTRGYQLVNTTKPGPSRWATPLVSLTFDSGRQSQYQNALPILEHDGYRATFYINPSTIETRGFMTAGELNDVASSGNEIGARGYDPDDMTAINSKALDYQLHEGRDYLRTAGFQVNDLAVPFGRSDAEVQYYARRYFTTLRGTEAGLNTKQSFDPHNLKVLNIAATTTPQQLTAALAAAKAAHGWLVLVYQGIGDTSLPQSSTSDQMNLTPAAFKQQMSLIRKSGITVLPVAAAYRAVQRQ